MSDIDFKCPSCKQELQAPTSMSGQTIECPNCKKPLIIPQTQTPPRETYGGTQKPRLTVPKGGLRSTVDQLSSRTPTPKAPVPTTLVVTIAILLVLCVGLGVGMLFMFHARNVATLPIQEAPTPVTQTQAPVPFPAAFPTQQQVLVSTVKPNPAPPPQQIPVVEPTHAAPPTTPVVDPNSPDVARKRFVETINADIRKAGPTLKAQRTTDDGRTYSAEYAGDFSYDIQKSDSIVSPFIGTVSWNIDWYYNGKANRQTLDGQYAYQDGVWVIKSVVRSAQGLRSNQLDQELARAVLVVMQRR